MLPLLYGDQIVARFEPEKYRKPGPLVIKNWWWEPELTVTPEMREAIGACLARFAMYLGAKGVVTK